MTADFCNLKINPKLVCNFLALFSRIEYSLKATIIYAQGNSKKVDPNWDKFANNIDKLFLKRIGENKKLKKAVDYIINNPPKKQIINNGKLEFINSSFDNTQKSTQQIILMVRRVRNNLFHGSKYHINPDNRDKKLIIYSLRILSECIKLDNDIYDEFYKFD